MIIGTSNTKSEHGLFYLDLAETSGTSFITMASDLEDLYSHCDVLKACEAGNLNALLVSPAPGPLSIFSSKTYYPAVTEFRQPLQVQSHLQMPGILVQLGHIQRT